MTDYTKGRADEAEALIDEAYDERDKWLFKYRDAVRLIMEINQFLASKGIVHPTKLSNQIISTIKDATEHIGSLAQQPQIEDTEPTRILTKSEIAKLVALTDPADDEWSKKIFGEPQPTEAEIDDMLAGDLPPEIAKPLEEIQARFNAEPKRECGTCKHEELDILRQPCRDCQIIEFKGMEPFSNWQPKEGA